MKYLSLAGLYNSGGKKMASGVQYSSKPDDAPANALAHEDGRVYELVKCSGTYSNGMLLYYTGTAQHVKNSGTGGVRPVGVAVGAISAAGNWAWVLRQGVGTVLITNTVSVAPGVDSLWTLGESAAVTLTAAISGAAIGSAGKTLFPVQVGRVLTPSATVEGEAYVDLL